MSVDGKVVFTISNPNLQVARASSSAQVGIEKSRSVYDRVQLELFPRNLLKADRILLRAFPEKTER